MAHQPVLCISVIVQQMIVIVVDSDDAQQTTLCILVSIPNVLGIFLYANTKTRSTVARLFAATCLFIRHMQCTLPDVSKIGLHTV